MQREAPVNCVFAVSGTKCAVRTGDYVPKAPCLRSRNIFIGAPDRDDDKVLSFLARPIKTVKDREAGRAYIRLNYKQR